MAYGPQFSDFLQHLRHTLDQNQGIGKMLGLGSGVWQSYEQRKRVPSIKTLLSIADTLVVKFPNRSVPSQAQFLAAWLAAQDIAAEDSLLRALRAIGPRRLSLTDLSSLSAFVFTGERREEQARTRLDCLIAPAAISDLRWVCGLGLDPGTEVIIDKELTLHPWDELVKRYGKRDIVSISSGAVNAMTGLLIDEMVFRFDALPEARRAYRNFVRDMAHLEDDAVLPAFQGCVAAADRLGSSQDPEALLAEAGLSTAFLHVAEEVTCLLGGSSPTQFTWLLRQAVLDPLKRARYQPERTSDYAVISFARHPFGAKDKVALVIAGTNGPATAAAIRLLANEGIEGRPLGAVLRIRQAVANGDPKAEIVTPRYEPRDIIESIDIILNGASARGPRTMLQGIFGQWTPQELLEWKNLVDTLGTCLAAR